MQFFNLEKDNEIYMKKTLQIWTTVLFIKSKFYLKPFWNLAILSGYLLAIQIYWEHVYPLEVKTVFFFFYEEIFILANEN